MNGITRRTALCTMGLAAHLASAKPKATAFALIGDRYHNSDYIRIGLGKTLGKDLGISIDFRDEVALLDAETLQGYKLLIIFRDGMTWPDGYPDESSNAAFAHLPNAKVVSDPPLPKWGGQPNYWISPAQGKAVRDFASAGGGVLFYHNVTYISPHNADFRDVLGAVTRQHPPIRPFKVRVVNKAHPITRDVNDFVVTDEQHYVTYEKDTKHLLLESVNEQGLDFAGLGKASAAGWAYDYGKGRVCYLAPGHLLVDLWNPEYEKLQKNAARWLMRQI